MPTVQELSINLEYPDSREGSGSECHQKQFYTPGDVMEGLVVLKLNTSLRVRGLYLNVLAVGHTAWDRPARKKTYEETETYFNHSEPLLNQGMGEFTLPKGCHRIAFRLQLPDNLPSTYHGTYGSVTHIARVDLEAEDPMMSTVTRQPFMVLRRDPLPPQSYNPVDVSKSKVYVSMEMGKIKVTVNLDHAVAVPGEAISVNAEVSNWSGKDITLLEGSLIMDTTYHAMKKRIVFRQYLNKRQDHFDVNLKWGRKWTDVKIQVPPYLPDSGLIGCNIIDIKYTFHFRAQIKGQDDIVVEAPLYVGYHQDGDEMSRDPRAMLMDRMFAQPPSRPQSEGYAQPYPEQQYQQRWSPIGSYRHN